MNYAGRDWEGDQPGDRRPVITLRVRRYAWVRWAAPVAIVTALLAGAAYQEWRPAPPQPRPVKPASEPAKAALSVPVGDRTRKCSLRPVRANGPGTYAASNDGRFRSGLSRPGPGWASAAQT